MANNRKSDQLREDTKDAGKNADREIARERDLNEAADHEAEAEKARERAANRDRQ
jgi:hypothetical protein